MAHDPKLEIYKLQLINKDDGRAATFRQLFRKKFNSYGNTTGTITNEDIFRAYYKSFVSSIDLKGYNVDRGKRKGFTLAYELNGGPTAKSLISSPTATNWIICGILEGGKHGIKRSLGEVSDKKKQTPIHTTNLVADRYFFLLYTPLEHSEAVLMIQGYTEAKISDVLRGHLGGYFKHKGEITNKTEIFVPQYLKEKYLNGAKFKSIQFTSGWAVPPDNSGTIRQKGYELEVRIEIKDKSQKKSDYREFSDLLKIFSKGIFQQGNKKKELEAFEGKKAKMVNGSKEAPIQFDNHDEVIPVILLKDEGIDVGDDAVPNFDQINQYCHKLLGDVIKEVMPEYAIDDL